MRYHTPTHSLYLKSIYFANILLSVCPDRHFISIDEYIRVSRYLNINYLVTETLQIDDRIYQIVGVRNKNVWVFQTHYTCKQIRLESFGVLAHVFVRSQNVNTGTSTHPLKVLKRVKNIITSAIHQNRPSESPLQSGLNDYPITANCQV